MHIDLITASKSHNKEVHATTNGKHTACRINLTKPENIGVYTSIGEMKDLIQITCEKCKTSIAKQIIRESNKEMKAQLKEEQRLAKREAAAEKNRVHQEQRQTAEPPRAASPIQAPVSRANAIPASSGGYVPPYMRKQQEAQMSETPVEMPAQQPQPAAPVNNMASQVDDVLAQFNVPTQPQQPQTYNVPTAPQPAAPMQNLANDVDDVLAQFNVPTQPQQPQTYHVPTAPQPAAPMQNLANDVDDVLAQFNVPTQPQTYHVPTAPQSAAPMQNLANDVDDVLAQFNVPTPPKQPIESQPFTAPMQNLANDVDDVLAQFNVPTQPQSAPMDSAEDVLAQFSIPQAFSEEPSSTPMPSPISADDVLSQFAIPAQQEAAKEKSDAEDILAQFSIPPQQTHDSLPDLSVPELEAFQPKPSAQPLSDPDDILAQFSLPNQSPSFDNVANSLFGGTPVKEEPAAPAAAPAVSAAADVLDAVIDETVAPAASAVQHAVSEEIIEINAEPAPDNFEPFPSVSTPSAVESAADDLPALDALEDLLISAGKESAATSAPFIEDLSDIPEIPETPVIPEIPEVPEISNVVSVPEVPAAPSYPQQPMGYPQQPMGYPQQPIGYPQQPMGYPQQPMGYPQQPMGYPQQPMGYPQQPMGYPQQPMGYPQQPMGMPYGNPYGDPQINLFAAPKIAEPKKPNTPTPLFVGYSAEGRQVFQNYDELGNPIPITEPIYSTPPTQPENPFINAAKGVGITPGLQQGGAPVLDVNETLAAFGIDNPALKKQQKTEKPIAYTEYKMPDKKKKAAIKPAEPVAEQPTGAISAAEAKRRKKLDRINREFEKQLKARNIDPETGAFIPKEKK